MIMLALTLTVGIFAAGVLPTRAARVPASGFVSVSGTTFVLAGHKFIPQGLNDQDYSSLWDSSNTAPGDQALAGHFKAFSALGFNSVRLNIKADYLDTPQGWQWLDKRLDEARKYGLKVMLDMHIPNGGAQQDYQPNQINQQIWSDPKLQRKFIATWKKISERYATNTTIWSYDLMNEPASRDINRVSVLLQHVCDTIRQADRNHIVILQPIQQYDDAYRESYVYAPLHDDKLAYSVHFYRPYGFTVQQVSWGITDARIIKNYPTTSTYDGTWDAARLAVELQFTGLAAARAAGVPVVIGEFGLVFTPEPSGQLAWIKDTLDAARAAGVGWYYWVYQAATLDSSVALTDASGVKRQAALDILSAATKAGTHAALKPIALR